jgi:hypothetical protein
MCLLITMQIFEVQLDQPRIVEIGCKVMSGPRRIPAHAVDGAPNLGRQTIDTFRIPRIVVPYLTAASECTWLIGKQEQQNSGHDWREPICVTHPHAYTRSRVKDLANAVAKQSLSGMPTSASGNVVRTNLIKLPWLRRQFRVKLRSGDALGGRRRTFPHMRRYLRPNQNPM